MSHHRPIKREHRLQSIEAQTAALQAQLSGRMQPNQFVWPEDVKLVKTVGDTGDPSYPTSGNTFPIVFLDGSYTAASGAQTPTLAQRSNDFQSYVHNLAARPFLPEGTIAVAYRIGKQWWTSTPNPIAQYIEFYLSGTLLTTNATTSVVVESYWGGSDPGSPQTVINPQAGGGFSHRYSGVANKFGEAVWDDNESKYRILQLEC